MAKHRTTTRGLRDEANVGPDPRRTRHLIPMRELGKFKVADGEPDIRGWTAFTSAGREIGRVDELLVDTDTNEVVMLDIDLRRDDRHTLAPLRAAWVDHATRRVVIGAEELSDADLPTLGRQTAPTDADVRDFDDRYDRAYGRYHEDDDRELRVRHADEELRFGRRPEVRDAHDRPLDAGLDRTADRDALRDATPADRLADAPARSRFVERHRVDDTERYRVADRGEREVRFPRQEERALDRRPLADDVVVRRRDADESLGRSRDLESGRDRDLRP